LSRVEKWKQGGILIAKHGNSTPATRIAIKNNILLDNKADPIVYYYVSKDSQDVAANWEHAGDSLFEDVQTTIIPENPRSPDLRLKSGSPRIDKGAFLTTVTGASGSGTQFQVFDAGYFTDGWGIIDGDIIQMSGSTQRARITAVDYISNIITVDVICSWSQNQGVTLAYTGSAPDMGAFEYNLTPIHDIPATSIIPGQFRIRPNPLPTHLLKKYMHENRRWELYDCAGKRITHAAITNSGIYLLKTDALHRIQKVIHFFYIFD
jgi:hypothetical protein